MLRVLVRLIFKVFYRVEVRGEMPADRRALIIANVALYVVQFLFPGIVQFLGLSPELVIGHLKADRRMNRC